MSLTLPDDVGAIRHLRRRPDTVVVAITGPGAGRAIAVELLHVLAVQALRTGLLERGITLTLPLHRADLAGRLPIVREIASGASGRVRVPTGGRALTSWKTGRRVRVIVGGVLVSRRPQGWRRYRHVHRFRLPAPIGVPIAIPADRDPIVIDCAMRQRVHVLIRQVPDAGRARVGVQALLVIHDAVHRILATRLTHRAASRARAARAVPRDHGTSFDPAWRHRFR